MSGERSPISDGIVPSNNNEIMEFEWKYTMKVVVIQFKVVKKRQVSDFGGNCARQLVRR